MDYKNMTLKARLLGGSLITLAVFAIVVAIMIFSMFRMSALQDEGAGRAEDAIYIGNTKANLEEFYGMLGNAIIEQTVTESEKEFNDDRDNIKRQMAHIKEIVDTDEERSDFAEFEARTNELIGIVFNEIIPSIKDGAASESPEMKRYMNKAFNALHAAAKPLNTITVSIEAENANAASRFDSVMTTTITISIIISLIGIAITLMVSLGIMNSVLGRLGGEPDLVARIAEKVAHGDLTSRIELKPGDNRSLMFSMKEMTDKLRGVISQIKTVSDTLASASTQLSSSSEEISSTTADQASRSSQIATSAEELTQTVMDVARNAGDISESAHGTVSAAQDGDRIVEGSIKEIREIAVAVSDTSKLMESLHDRSKQIGEIVKVINDIADQTNLLALNAAIEAARAGEQGRGFAVVADEVRKLAERTARATSEIGGMIASIQREVDESFGSMKDAIIKVDNGVELSTKAGSQLKTIVTSISSLQGLVQQIASATEEMSSVAETIGSDVTTIADSSREISSGTNQIAQSSSDLSRMASTLKTTMEGFKL